MIKKFNAFSLIELVLATAIMGIVLLSVYSSFTLAMRTWKRVKVEISNNAVQIFIPLTRQLRSAYLSTDYDPSFSFQGSSSSLRFTTTAIINDDIYLDNATDLKKVFYSLNADPETGQRALIYEEYDVLGENKENLKKEYISNIIRSISFAFYDGKQWKRNWDSSKKLPLAVKISADFQEGVFKDSFETIALIACSDKEIADSL